MADMQTTLFPAEKFISENDTKSCFRSAIIPNMEYNICNEKNRRSIMDFITARDAAQAWGISVRRVSTLCATNRIPDVEMLGNMWLIPRSAQKPDDARSKAVETIHPIIKWVGGKGQLLDEISRKYPAGLGTTIKSYVEPFVGGGAVLFDLLGKYNFEHVYISDTNAELINLYCQVRDHAEEVISLLKKYEAAFLPLNDEGRKAYYYDRRDEFNELIVSGQSKNSLIAAALFVFLNRTCFNGLYRVNGKGLFNVPMGAYKNPRICDEENLRRVSKALQNVEICCADYKESKKYIDENSLVYLDPPYRPLNITSSFTSYTENGFGDKDQIELAGFVQELSQLKASVILSNSDPKNSDENDNFFDDLYKKQKIFRVAASRMINSKAESRGKISEILVCNY